MTGPALIDLRRIRFTDGNGNRVPTLGDFWAFSDKTPTPGRWRQFMRVWNKPKNRRFKGRSRDAYQRRLAHRVTGPATAATGEPMPLRADPEEPKPAPGPEPEPEKKDPPPKDEDFKPVW